MYTIIDASMSYWWDIMKIYRLKEGFSVPENDADEYFDPYVKVVLKPSYHGQDCPASGDDPAVECCCDECNYFLACFPDWKDHQ